MTKPPETLAELRALADDELVTLHDREMKHIASSQALYRDELDRRAAERGAKETNELSKTAMWLAVISLVVSMASLSAASTFAAAAVDVGRTITMGALVLAGIGLVAVLYRLRGMSR
jgi:hypothetical protein